MPVHTPAERAKNRRRAGVVARPRGKSAGKSQGAARSAARGANASAKARGSRATGTARSGQRVPLPKRETAKPLNRRRNR